jgi:hypothetical protein
LLPKRSIKPEVICEARIFGAPRLFNTYKSKEEIKKSQEEVENNKSEKEDVLSCKPR